MSNVKCFKKRGFALATTLVLLGVVLIGAGSILTISRIEARISRSQKESLQAYYVAEAGVQNAIWQINHDQGLPKGNTQRRDLHCPTRMQHRNQGHRND